MKLVFTHRDREFTIPDWDTEEQMRSSVARIRGREYALSGDLDAEMRAIAEQAARNWPVEPRIYEQDEIDWYRARDEREARGEEEDFEEDHVEVTDEQYEQLKTLHSAIFIAMQTYDRFIDQLKHAEVHG
jgi:hypothetical protein